MGQYGRIKIGECAVCSKEVFFMIDIEGNGAGSAIFMECEHTNRQDRAGLNGIVLYPVSEIERATEPLCGFCSSFDGLLCDQMPEEQSKYKNISNRTCACEKFSLSDYPIILLCDHARIS